MAVHGDILFRIYVGEAAGAIKNGEKSSGSIGVEVEDEGKDNI